MSQAKRDRCVYKFAMKFLLGLDRVTSELVAHHLSLPDSLRPASMPGVYEKLLLSAQSPNMMPSVIGKSIGGVANLKTVLCHFQPKTIVKKYGSDWKILLDVIVRKLKPKGEVRRGRRSIWPRFCVAALSGAKFLSQFSGWKDFDGWVQTFDDSRSRAALPMLLAQEIEGFGFALAGDFLKNIGYTMYAKPDVHLRDIFTSLGLCDSDKDYDVFKAIVRMAENVGQTPYHVDKLFWLIGSGNFRYSGIEIGGHKKAFLSHAKNHGI